MKKDMYNDLDKFFANKTTPDIDRNTFLVCNLRDKELNITISLVFMRDWHTNIEYSDYDQVILENKGTIFIFPPYWVTISKELAMSYFEELINSYYKNELGIDLGNADGSSSADGNGNGSGSIPGGCPCHPRNVNI